MAYAGVKWNGIEIEKKEILMQWTSKAVEFYTMICNARLSD